MTETVCVELTEAGASGTDRYHPGQRVLLPAQTARYFARNGWAIILDDETEQETPA